MREIKVRLRKNYGAVDILINNILICSFEKNGNFLFWGQSNGSPKFEGRWRNRSETGEFTFELIDEIDEIVISINDENQAFFDVNGSFEFYGTGENPLYEDRWDQ